MSPLPINSGAIFSPCRCYRYVLWREWDNKKGTCVFIGLNPSTANEFDDDPTIRRCIHFAKDWGYGKLVMLNLFALSATDPEHIKTSTSPIGENNNKHLINECYKADIVVAAWGNNGLFLERDKALKELLPTVKMMCFKITQAGQPIHPLYQRSNSVLIEYK